MPLTSSHQVCLWVCVGFVSRFDGVCVGWFVNLMGDLVCVLERMECDGVFIFGDENGEQDEFDPFKLVQLQFF